MTYQQKVRWISGSGAVICFIVLLYLKYVLHW